MDREAFGKKSLNHQCPRTDRFIPPRSSIEEEKQKRVLYRLSKENEHQQNNWYTKNLHQKRYTSYFDGVFGLNAPRWSSKSNDHTSRHGHGAMDCVQHWPCAPRTKPYLSSVNSVLDLPTYRYAIFPEILDWGRDDILVAALESIYYKWSWRTQRLVDVGQALQDVHCCKFDPRGELLALGTSYKCVEIHHHSSTKLLMLSHCLCLSTYCQITSVDWSPTGNSYVAGCSKGTLSSYERGCGNILNFRRVFRREILFVRISPNTRFIACTAVAAPCVRLFTWPMLVPYMTVDSNWIVKSITWHPWRSALLAVGAVIPNQHTSIALWDAPTGKLRQTTISPDRMNVDTMLFSDKTGELVLSLWNSDRSARLETKNGSRLVVLSDPDTVVDQWGEGRRYLNRVRTMVFSPDGTKLATATTDEDLIIWRFLPEDEERMKKASVKRRFSALPLYLDQTTDGFSIR